MHKWWAQFDFSMEKVAVAGNQILAKGLRLNQPVFLIPLQPLAFTILYMYTCTTTQMVLNISGTPPIRCHCLTRLASFPDSLLLSGESLGTRLWLGLVQQSCTCRLHYCSVFVEVVRVWECNRYKLLTLHMILRRYHTLASVYLREIHRICSRGSDTVMF